LSTSGLLCHGKRTRFRGFQPYVLELEKRELLATSLPPPPGSAPVFQDVTTQAGILTTPLGEEMSMSWVDVNGDGRPDLWVGRQDTALVQPPNLYINQGNGTFVDAFNQMFNDRVNGDSHAGVWADYNNSGLPGLYNVNGAVRGSGSDPKFFYENIGGHFIDEATAAGLADPPARGRNPVPFDWNRNGLLDVLSVYAHRPDGKAPTTLYNQTATGFQDVTAAAGLTGTSTTSGAFGEVADLTGNGANDLIYVPENEPPTFYSENQGIFSAVANVLPADRHISDIAIADFNNDGYLDIFLSTTRTDLSDVEQFSPTQVGAMFIHPNPTFDQGFSFQSNGPISFDLQLLPVSLKPNQVFIGSSGMHPSQLPITLNPNDPNVQGIQSHQAGQGQGMYIGYDPTTQLWTVLESDINVKNQGCVINSTAPITGLTSIGFDPSQFFNQNYLLMYDPSTGQFVDKTQAAGLGGLYSTSNVVAGDFTNDMHTDLVLIQETRVAGLPDIYFHNNGDGTFTKSYLLPNGPQGLVGPLDSALGYGKKGIAADFNGDGALDLFVSNADFRTWGGVTYPGWPNQLLQNMGNSNHWLELSLQGTVSNRDGVGAKVYVTAGGVTQLQEETDGLHHYAQNSSVLHFGLAQNTTVDKVIIDWPSGITQEIDNVAANQILKVVEPGGHTLATARTIPVYLSGGPYTGQVSLSNASDYYGFAVAATSNLRVDLFNLTADANVQLLDSNGNVLAQSSSGGSSKELLVSVNAGTYYVAVLAPSDGSTTNYALRLTDESQNDTQGPTASLVKIADVLLPNVMTTAAPTISAWIDDTSTGNTKIVAAEYFIDSVGAPGTGVAMTAQEGQFSGAIENVTATMDATTYANLSTGTHTIYVRGEDAAGNWGPTASAMFTPDTVTHFHFSPQTFTTLTTTAGVPFFLNVTALDAAGHTVNGYTGTVGFSSSDGQAVLPGNATFTAEDAGAHTIYLTLKTAGSQTITATDATTSSITGTSPGITVNPAAAKFLIIAHFPSSVVAGSAHSITIRMQDAFGNIATGYQGTIHFSSSDSMATLPADYTFTAADGGVHTFVNGVTLQTVGAQSITVADTVNTKLTRTRSNIQVTGASAPASRSNGAAAPGTGIVVPDTTQLGHPLTETRTEATLALWENWPPEATPFLLAGVPDFQGVRADGANAASWEAFVNDSDDWLAEPGAGLTS
jgi:hypothetical protein